MDDSPEVLSDSLADEPVATAIGTPDPAAAPAAAPAEHTALTAAAAALKAPRGPLGEALLDSGKAIIQQLTGLAEISGAALVRESDLVLFTLLETGRMLPDGHWLRRELASGLADVWHTAGGSGIGGWDLGSGVGSATTGAVEAKWITKDKSHELLWDVFKLGQALALGRLDEAYLLIGITKGQRSKPKRPNELIDGGAWQTRDLLTAYETSWSWCTSGVSIRPFGGLPAAVATEPVAEAEIVPGTSLVLVRVTAAGGLLPTDDTGSALLPAAS